MANNHSNYRGSRQQHFPQPYIEEMSPEYHTQLFYCDGGFYQMQQYNQPYLPAHEYKPEPRMRNQSMQEDFSRADTGKSDPKTSKDFFDFIVQCSGVAPATEANTNVTTTKAQPQNEFLNVINNRPPPSIDVKAKEIDKSFFKTVQEAKNNSNEIIPQKLPAAESIKVADSHDVDVVQKPTSVVVGKDKRAGVLIRKTANEHSSVKLAKYGTYRNGTITYTKEDIDAISFSAEEFGPFITRITKLLIQFKAKPVVKKGVGAWKGMSEKLEDGTYVSNESKYTFKIMSIFNKLSIPSYSQLFAEFSKIDIGTTQKVQEYISVLFDKATKESSNCYIYADFYKRALKVVEKCDNQELCLVQFLKEALNKLIFGRLERDNKQEQDIASLKAFKSNDEDKVDEVLNELAEKEKTYKKPILGTLQFVSELFSIGVLEQNFVYKIYENLKNKVDAFGMELLSRFIQFTGDLVYSLDKFKSLVDTELERMQTLAPSLPFEIRFCIIDTIKMKSEGFKKTERKTVPFVSGTGKTATVATGKQRVMQMMEIKNKHRTQAMNSRDRNANIKGRSYGGLSKSKNQFSNLANQKFARDHEPVPTERPTVPAVVKPVPGKSWKLSSSAVPEKVVVEAPVKDKKVDLEVIVPDLFMVEFDIDEAFFEIRDYQLNKYSLEFTKIGLRVILENKRMHLSFGLLLVRLISSFGEFKNCIPAAIKHIMQDLPMNAMDEPILWTRLYFVLIPLLCVNCITLDDIVNILSTNDEVENPIQNVVALFDLCKKELALGRLFKIMYWNKNSETLKKVLNVSKNMKIVYDASLSNEQNTLLNDFYDSSIDNAVILREISGMYSDCDSALADLAKETYMNCLIGKEFNSNLANILTVRKQLFTGHFKLQGSDKFIRYFTDHVIRFDCKFELFSYIGLAMCKAEHVDIDWLKKLPSTIQNEQFRDRISIQVATVVNQLQK